MNEITKDRQPLEHLESLDAILSIAASMEQVDAGIGTLFRMHVIVDTNIIVADLRFIASKQKYEGARPAVLELLAKKTLVGYFPLEKLGEVDAKCVELSERYSIPHDVLHQLWSNYQRHLHIVPTSTLERERLDSQTLAARDPTDVPFLQARHIVGGAVVLTNDPDIHASGAPVMPWSRVLVDLREHERKRAAHAAIIFGTGTAIIVSIAALVGCVRLICHAWQTIPPKAILAGAVALGVALLIPQSRSVLIKTGKAALAGLGATGRAVGPVLADAHAMAAKAKAHADGMRPMLYKELHRATKHRLTLSQAVCRACLLEVRPMTEAEIWTIALRDGAKSRARDPLKSVLKALKRHPLVSVLPDGRWQISVQRQRISAR